MFRHTLGRELSLGQWALHVLYLGTFWGCDKGTIPGRSSHSPAFANVHRGTGGSHYLQQQVCVLSFSLFASLSPVGFEAGA